MQKTVDAKRAAVLAGPLRDQAVKLEIMRGERLVDDIAVSSAPFQGRFVSGIIGEFEKFIKNSGFSFRTGEYTISGTGFRADFRLSSGNVQNSPLDAMLSFDGGVNGSVIYLYLHQSDKKQVAHIRKGRGLDELAAAIKTKKLC